MNSKIYYIKPENSDFTGAITKGLLKGLSLVRDKKYNNLKFIISDLSLLDSPTGFIGKSLSEFGNGEDLIKQLKKQRGFSIPNFPEDGETTGINLLLASKEISIIDDKTVAVLVWADRRSYVKVLSNIHWLGIDLIAVVFNEERQNNVFLSATKAENIRKVNDPNVIPYKNSFTPEVNEILDRLKGINLTEVASHNPTRERIDSVINELEKKKHVVSYTDFLGFLVNDVNYVIEESIELLGRKHKYFNQ